MERDELLEILKDEDNYTHAGWTPEVNTKVMADALLAYTIRIKAAALEDAARDGWNAVIEYGELTQAAPPVGYLHNWLRARATELRTAK